MRPLEILNELANRVSKPDNGINAEIRKLNTHPQMRDIVRRYDRGETFGFDATCSGLTEILKTVPEADRKSLAEGIVAFAMKGFHLKEIAPDTASDHILEAIRTLPETDRERLLNLLGSFVDCHEKDKNSQRLLRAEIRTLRAPSATGALQPVPAVNF